MAFCAPPLGLAPRVAERSRCGHNRRYLAACLPEIRDVPLLAVPMTSGADVLFPGSAQQVPLSPSAATRILDDVCPREPPEFAHLVINAWGEPGDIATLAVIDHLVTDQSSLLCTGISRCRVLHIADDLSSARIEPFYDDTPADGELDDIAQLEDRLVKTMTQIVSLTIKISHQAEAKQRALTETLRRVEAFCGKGEPQNRELLQHWILQLSPLRRRELLSFIVIDLLSISFMDRKNLLASTNTGNRLAEALRCLQPFVKELAAKGAIVSALGHDSTGPDLAV